MNCSGKGHYEQHCSQKAKPSSNDEGKQMAGEGPSSLANLVKIDSEDLHQVTKSKFDPCK